MATHCHVSLDIMCSFFTSLSLSFFRHCSPFGISSKALSVAQSGRYNLGILSYLLQHFEKRRHQVTKRIHYGTEEEEES